jgi:hypothetical protein
MCTNVTSLKFFFMPSHKAPEHNEKKRLEKNQKSKNCAHDGREGQSRQGDSAMCNAGFPTHTQDLLIARDIRQGKYKEKRKRKKILRELARPGTHLYTHRKGGEGRQD